MKTKAAHIHSGHIAHWTLPDIHLSSTTDPVGSIPALAEQELCVSAPQKTFTLPFAPTGHLSHWSIFKTRFWPIGGGWRELMKERGDHANYTQNGPRLRFKPMTFVCNDAANPQQHPIDTGNTMDSLNRNTYFLTGFTRVTCCKLHIKASRVFWHRCLHMLNVTQTNRLNMIEHMLGTSRTLEIFLNTASHGAGGTMSVLTNIQ